MNCLNRDQIQAYIDGETGPVTKKQWEEHMASCARCKALYREAKDEIQLLHETLASFDHHPVEIPQPDRFTRRHRIVRKKHLHLLLQVAALLVMIFGITVIISRNAVKKRLYTNIEKTTRKLTEDKDLNEMWRENQSVIIITNNKGEVIQSGIF
ncbi:MAG: hypothetical protein GXO83_02775 [Chlorobi bacterium]|nr:hypothetical protein [Chlorobiota bacterium]